MSEAGYPAIRGIPSKTFQWQRMAENICGLSAGSRRSTNATCGMNGHRSRSSNCTTFRRFKTVHRLGAEFLKTSSTAVSIKLLNKGPAAGQPFSNIWQELGAIQGA
jgi:hypothetical protein